MRKQRSRFVVTCWFVGRAGGHSSKSPLIVLIARAQTSRVDCVSWPMDLRTSSCNTKVALLALPHEVTWITAQKNVRSLQRTGSMSQGTSVQLRTANGAVLVRWVPLAVSQLTSSRRCHRKAGPAAHLIWAVWQPGFCRARPTDTHRRKPEAGRNEGRSVSPCRSTSAGHSWPYIPRGPPSPLEDASWSASSREAQPMLLLSASNARLPRHELPPPRNPARLLHAARPLGEGPGIHRFTVSSLLLNLTETYISCDDLCQGYSIKFTPTNLHT